MTKNNQFKIPESFWDKLYEFTGSSEDLRGFVVAYISSDNVPMVKSICRNPVVETSLLKTISDYEKSQHSQMQGVDANDFGGDDDDDEFGGDGEELAH